MDLGSWEGRTTDVARLKRMALGWVAGACIMSGTLVAVALTAAKAYGLDEEQVVEAALVDGPEDEPHIEAQPEPEQKVEKPKPRANAIVEPTKVDDKLVEKEPVKSDNPFAGEDPYANIDTTERPAEVANPVVAEAAPKIIEKPKPVAAPKSNDPLRVTEDVTPPKALNMSAPSYPADAKAAGIEGTVIVKYVVTESGEVTNVSAVRGPEELKAVCEAAVKNWKFEPALKDGKPVAVHRMARFPFRIKA
jgi:protein TonB